MDSRAKIVTPDRLEAMLHRETWTVVAGTFDPLTAEQARRLASRAAPATKLAVVVEAAAHESLLTPEVRAILVAALRCVDAVTVVEHAPAFFGDVPVERDPAGEHARTQAFLKLLATRQAGADR